MTSGDPALPGWEEAQRLKGRPLRVELPIAPPEPPSDRGRLPRQREAEVLMVMPRPGGLLFHTKSFYPPGILRLLTGGVHPGEAILDAAAREVLEETGLALEPVRFLFHAVQQIQRGEERKSFHTLAFLYPASSDPVHPADPEEEICLFQEVPWEEVPEMARRLEALEAPWRSWGAFRAAPHRVLLRLRRERPELFEG